MAFPAELKELFQGASQAVESTFLAKELNAGSQVSPSLLIEALNQFFYVFDKLDEEHGEQGEIPFDDVSQLADQAIGCLSDMAFWAERLHLPKDKQELEQVTLGVAHWAVRHGAELRTLEPVVNALAFNANATESPERLRALYQVIEDVIEHTAPALQNDLEKSDPTRPWRILNLNAAIVATRTQDEALMRAAFERLGRALPGDAPAFFEEGLKQSQKPIYGEAVRAVMQDYFNRWNVRH